MMPIVEYPLNQCCSGDIVADDVLDSQGVTWVGRDTVLNPYILNRLEALHVEKIRVYAREPSGNEQVQEIQEIYAKNLLRLKTVTHDLIMGKPVRLHEIEGISDDIYRAVHANETVVKYLLRLREADEYTYSHCMNTSFYCLLISKWMNLPEDLIKKSVQAGLLHDIGKARIPDEVLNKKGSLTKEEFDIIKKHPEIGYGLVRNISDLDSGVKDAVLYHHERMDRSGYPRKVSADQLCLIARIAAVADVFDAMTSNRVYKKGCSPFKAFEMFQTVGVGIFDPVVVQPFITRLSSYYAGCRVLLNDGTEGEIVYVPPHSITAPIVQINQEILDLSEREDLQITSIL